MPPTQYPLTAPSRITNNPTSTNTPLPRVLITGFGAFPGAPTNPTERLVPLILAERDAGVYEGVCELTAVVLPVEYRRVPKLLAELCGEGEAGYEMGGEGHEMGDEGGEEGGGGQRAGTGGRGGEMSGQEGGGTERGDGNGYAVREAGLAEQSKEQQSDIASLSTVNGPPDTLAMSGRKDGFGFDIAIHFGLHASSTSITLEHLARNEIRPSPDASGYIPPSRSIHPSGPNYPSTLPLDAIGHALSQLGIQYEDSDDAGGYLCNYIFYLGSADLVKGFNPPMSGFVHVPPGDRMGVEEVGRAARCVIQESCKAWMNRSEGEGER